jgi:transketolase
VREVFSIDITDKRKLAEIACRVRLGIIESTYGAKSGHPGGSLSSAEMLTYLYFKEMNIDPNNPTMENRDRFVLSKGHCTPGLYSVLANRGFFPVDDLPTFRHIDSYLQGHPSMTVVPGVDMSTGSLGQGVSASCGIALGLKKRGGSERVYALLGDGELQEGQVWEALMFAAHFSLDNLCIIIDNNNLQIDGAVTDVMSPYPIREKLEAFGFSVIEVDGHSFEELEEAFNTARSTKGKPSAILMKTIKGKGVSFMENQAGWHGKAPNDEEYKIAKQELSEALAALEVSQ